MRQVGKRLSRESLESKLSAVGRVLSIAFFLAITGFPFYWMLVLSFRPYGDVQLNPGRMIPRWEDIQVVFAPLACIGNASGEACRQMIASSSYAAVLVRYNFLTFVRNSLIIAGMTVVISLALAVPAAYAMTRIEFRGRSLIGWGILLIYMFPSIVVSIPLFVFFVRLQNALGIQLRSPLGVTLIYLASTLPVALHMLRSYLTTIPADLEDAAKVDGATRLGVIRRIAIPLAAPAIASVALYIFMVAWNEFLYALLFLVDSPPAWTLPLGLQQLDSQEVPRTFLMAGSVIISAPVVALFFVFEKFLTSGLTAGGVKG